jgi:beta-fructofuranosidase
MALLYRSSDLVRWSYVQPLCVGDSDSAGQVWECPDFFPLGDRHCLLVSIQPEFLHTYYFLGTYADHTFTPASQGLTDFGPYFYAAQTQLDDQGRRLMWGWVKEGRSAEAQQAAGWAGVMSLPRLLSLRPDGLPGMAPAPELRVLRGRHHRFTDIHLTPSSSDVLGDVKGDCLEILVVAEFGPGGAGRFGLKVRCSPDGEEQTLITYDRAAGRLAVDRDRSSLSPEVSRGVQEGPFELDDDECLRLRVFLDRSVVEVFANDHACLTDRIYPTRTDSLGLDLFAYGGSAMLNTVDIWEMEAIWPTSDRAKGEG